MNQSQIKYAKERLAVVMKGKRVEIESVSVETPPLSQEEKYALIKKGEAKLLPLDSVSSGYGNGNAIFSCYSFPYEEKRKKEKDALDKKRGKLLSQLKEDYTKLLDELMLGDSEEALKIIQDFTNKQYSL